MPSYHLWREGFVGKRCYYRVNKNRGLRDIRLFEFVCSPTKHGLGDTETKNCIGLLKVRFRLWVCFVKVFAHTGKLGTLPGEDVCLHTFGVN